MTEINLGEFPNKQLSLSFYIKSITSFSFLTNIAIIVSILAYYMNAIEIFFIFAPLIIVNFITSNVVQLFNFDEFMLGLLQKELPNKEDRDKAIPKYAFFGFLWHLLPLLWLIYILDKDDIIKIFHPKFMEVFLKSAIIPILYYYYEKDLKIYGELNYLFYLIIYILLLLASCYYLYEK